MIPLHVVADTVFVFDLAHVELIRKLGIVGILVGTLPKAPQQNVFLGLPLQLSAYEACYLVLLGHARFVDGHEYNRDVAAHYSVAELNANGRVGEEALQYAVTPNSILEPPSFQVSPASCLSLADFVGRQKLDAQFAQKLAAFCYLRNLDYYLMPGLRFGGVFVAYPGDPLKYHSHLIVKVIPTGGKVDLLELVTSGRLATAVKKAWVTVGQKGATVGQKTTVGQKEATVGQEGATVGQEGATIGQKGATVGQKEATVGQEEEATNLTDPNSLLPHPQGMTAFSFEWAGFG